MSSCLKLNKRVDFNFNWNSIRRCFYFYFFFTFLISIGNLRQVKVFFSATKNIFFFHRRSVSVRVLRGEFLSLYRVVIVKMKKFCCVAAALSHSRLYGWMRIPASAFSTFDVEQLRLQFKSRLWLVADGNGEKFNLIDFFCVFPKRCQDWVIFFWEESCLVSHVDVEMQFKNFNIKSKSYNERHSHEND